MRIPFAAAFACAGAGAIAYLNSEGGAGAVLGAAGAAGAALCAVLVSSRRIERGVTGFARAVSKGKFSRYKPERGGSEKMEKALNAAMREIESRIRKAGEKNTRLFAALNKAGEGALCVSSSGRITFANTTARAMLAGGAEIEGKNYWETVLNPQIRALIKDALEKGGHETLKREIVDPYPRENCYIATAARMEGKTEAVVVLSDSTESKRLEAAQKDLIANMFHEIRTPVTSIIGAAETIADRSRAGKNDKEIEKLALILERNTRRLADLCSRAIGISELEQRAAQAATEFQTLDVSDAVKNAASLMKSPAEKKNITIETVCEEGLKINGDPLMIENMFVNLIENAVKYSREGGKVEIEAAEKDGAVTVSVKDYGAGIEKKHISRVFERFYRTGAARLQEGSGLGLSIALQTAEVHGGTITVESEFGKGSVFAVKFERQGFKPLRRSVL